MYKAPTSTLAPMFNYVLSLTYPCADPQCLILVNVCEGNHQQIEPYQIFSEQW